MGIGVTIYSIVVASLTSIFTAEGTLQESLALKLRAFEIFAQDVELNSQLKKDIVNFLINNYQYLALKVEIETMINELTPTLKEDVLFNQFGFLIKSLEFFQDIKESQCWWNIAQLMQKIQYDGNDKIYQDGQISDTIYFIHKGTVKLYSDNGFPFANFKAGNTVGDNDVLTGTKRNGTATAMELCQLYKIQKNQLDDALKEFKAVKRDLI